MGTNEPVAAAFSLQAFLTLLGAWIGYRGFLPGEEIALLIPLVLMGTAGLLAWWARSRVTSEQTLIQAGTTIEAVREVADTPGMILVPQGTGDGGPPPSKPTLG